MPASRQKWSIVSFLGNARLLSRYESCARDTATRRAGWRRPPYACTSVRQRPTTLEQGIAHRPEETSRAEARLVHSSFLEIARSRRDLAIFNLAIDSTLRTLTRSRKA